MRVTHATKSSWIVVLNRELARLGFYWVLLGFIGFYLVILDVMGFYWVLLGFTWFHGVLLDYIGFHRVLLDFTGFYGVSLGSIGFYRVSRGFTGFYQVRCWNDTNWARHEIGDTGALIGRAGQRRIAVVGCRRTGISL